MSYMYKHDININGSENVVVTTAGMRPGQPWLGQAAVQLGCGSIYKRFGCTDPSLRHGIRPLVDPPLPPLHLQTKIKSKFNIYMKKIL